MIDLFSLMSMLIIMFKEFPQLQEGFTQLFRKFWCLHDGNDFRFVAAVFLQYGINEAKIYGSQCDRILSFCLGSQRLIFL